MSPKQQVASRDSALLSAVLKAAVDAMIVADANGIIIRANPAARAMFGYDEAEMIDRSINMLMPEALAEMHDGFMQAHLKTGKKRIIGIGRDVEGQRKDGTVFPLHLSVGNAEVDGEKLFVGILHDLTTRRAAQEALARSQRLDAIGQLTGGIAHDFNNLLTVIIGNLELLQMRMPSHAQSELVSDALDSAQLGADLTSRLLVFARKGYLNPIRTDLRQECTAALSILKRTIGEAYTIRTEFSETVDEVLIDPIQLQSALINLALNARDAMPDGGELLIAVANITIDDTYMAQETDIAPGEYVRVFVSDNGMGMDEEAQKRAFEPFFSTKAEGSGTGLGLAMVYGFVRQSGGHVTLYSEPGLGTSFGLYFPKAQSASDSDSEESGPQEAPQSGATQGSGQVVLVVEDNARVRKLSVERIRDLGYTTLEAANGDAAYEMLRKGTAVDVVFSDLVMPGALNGYALAERVNRDFPDVKILLTSGYASDVVIGQLGEVAKRDVLHKPYRQNELAERLQALLGVVS